MLALRNHKKSKDVRQRFFAQAHRAYEENRKKAAAFTRGQGLPAPPDQEPADDRMPREDDDRSPVVDRQDVLLDIWTWTLGSPLGPLEEIGAGAYGLVFRTSFLGQPLVLKVGKGRSLPDPMRQAAVGGVDVAEEFDVLTSVGQHPNVVRAFAVLTSSLGRPALVLEPATESLHAAACRLKAARDGWLACRKSLVPLFQQFLVGLSYVHGRSFLHLDVKPSNILVFEGNRAAIADFGLAREMVQEACCVIGNRAYTEAFRCPECLMAADRKVWTVN